AVIRENIELCRFPDKAHFVHADVLKTLPSLASQGPFQIIFVDPPYGKGMVPTTIEMVSRLSLLDSDGILCAETARKEILPDRIGELELLDQRHYGSTTISFFTLHPTESNGE
ncbi:MAG TPA: RsmD family RNA methyltransferase, partial [Desulfuromonadales bacterium]|nr:RsmD family RNA methyltransferase [Desulfuromonadales bacterium]